MKKKMNKSVHSDKSIECQTKGNNGDSKKTKRKQCKNATGFDFIYGRSHTTAKRSLKWLFSLVLNIEIDTFIMICCCGARSMCFIVNDLWWEKCDPVKQLWDTFFFVCVLNSHTHKHIQSSDTHRFLNAHRKRNHVELNRKIFVL